MARGGHLAVVQEDGGGFRKAVEHIFPVTGQFAVMRFHLEAVFGQPDGRGQGGLQGQLAVVLRQVHKGGGLAGDAGGAGAVQCPVTHYLAIAILVHGGDGGVRGGFPGIHEGLQAVTFPMQQPETAAAHTR